MTGPDGGDRRALAGGDARTPGGARQARMEALPVAAILDAAADGIILVNVEGRITFVNRAAAAIFGMAPEDLVAHDRAALMQRVFIGNDRPMTEAESLLQRVLESGRAVYGADLRFVRSDQTDVMLSFNVAPWHDEQGRIVGVVSSIRDVTRERRIEAEAREGERRLRDGVRRLEAADRERRRLLARLMSAQEEERHRIARDIHDDLVQIMAGVNLRLEVLRRRLDEPAAAAAVCDVMTTVQLAMTRLRGIVLDLRPSLLDSSGLAAALRLQLEQVQDRFGLQQRLEDALVEEPPPAVRVGLFRVAQEAIANVVKHARARSVTVVLAQVDGGVLLEVTDDGVGWNGRVAPRADSMGIISMRERTEALGGQFDVNSGPGRGTTVTAWVPWADGEAAPTREVEVDDAGAAHPARRGPHRRR